MPYLRQPLDAPRLAGLALRLFTAAAELPGLGDPLRRAMLKAAGIPAFRRIPADEAPVALPPLPGSGDPADEPVAPAARPEPASGVEGAAAFAAACARGDTTPSAVAERFLGALDQYRHTYPGRPIFLATDSPRLHELARQSALRHVDRRPFGPLDGVPIAIKDELDLAGYPTTVGTAFLGRSPAATDATAVARLRAAGALLLGKVNMQEAGLGVTGINPHHGTPINPYDPSRVPGGSSSGSAAAVASGLCPIALSADAGGSIRIPAALCGVVGLKPTFGRVSERGAAPLGWSLAHVGVIARTARDAALAYAAVAGPDPLDPITLNQPAPRAPDLSAGDLRGLILGVYRPWFEDADADVVSTCRAGLDVLRAAGARIREIDIPDVHLVRPVHLVTVAVEWAAAFGEPHARHRRRMGHDVRLILALARALRGTDYVHAQRLRRRVCARFADALREVDAIATPATACTAPPLRADALKTGESDFATLDRLTRFVLAGNVTGLPAMTFPVGHDRAGLPIGLQLMGRAWREDVLLRIAASADGFIERRTPKVHYRLLT